MSDSVTVAMYNVGFGDCFLVRFPGPDRERRVLIDCGSIKKGARGGTEEVVEHLIADVTDDDGVARIDVVVATHRHRDHVSGFGRSEWRHVVVEEVWLPWTENPADDTARQLQHDIARFAADLGREVTRLQGLSEGSTELIDHVLLNTLSLSNEAAMDTLHRGFAGGTALTRRFLHRQADPLVTPALPGVTVHVLGPSDDEAIIRDMDPPSDESFLRAMGDGALADGDDGESLPFTASDRPRGDLSVSDELVAKLRRLSVEAALLGAVGLEKAVNNTSLMLAFEMGEAVLFFPGDAQWGPWEQNLDDPRTVELLRRTSFYKVGHHGSHNATPVSFVEEVLPGREAGPVVAAASVTSHGRFAEIPKHELMERLGARLGADRVIRSDQPLPAAVTVPVAAGRSTGGGGGNGGRPPGDGEAPQVSEAEGPVIVGGPVVDDEEGTGTTPIRIDVTIPLR